MIIDSANLDIVLTAYSKARTNKLENKTKDYSEKPDTAIEYVSCPLVSREQRAICIDVMTRPSEEDKVGQIFFFLLSLSKTRHGKVAKNPFLVLKSFEFEEGQRGRG